MNTLSRRPTWDLGIDRGHYLPPGRNIYSNDIGIMDYPVSNIELYSSLCPSENIEIWT